MSRSRSNLYPIAFLGSLIFLMSSVGWAQVRFEDWEGPYPSGNMWASFATCAQASYVCNPASSGEAITTCYDSNAADAHGGSYCWKTMITWNVVGPTQYAQIAPFSAYGGDYGFPISISSSPQNYLSIWLKSDTAPVSFYLFFQDSNGPSSGTPLHTSFYQNGTGSNYYLTIPTANTWTNFSVPLTPGTSVWSFDPTLMNWGSILDIGTYLTPPAVGPGQQTTLYMDDFYFMPNPAPTNTPTPTPTGTWYSPTSTNTYTPTYTYSITNTFTSTYTRTITPIPTNTNTYTITYTPTVTNTGTLPTSTNTNTKTSTPSNTPTITCCTAMPTGTWTWTPTYDPTPLPTRTFTHTYSPTYTGTWYTSTPTNTLTNSPTNSITNTPTNTPTNTISNTPTNSPSNTPTGSPTLSNTPTPTPASNIIFENWEGPYPSGNMWAPFATCAQASFICNPAVLGSGAITTCYDSTPGDAHSGTYCWKNNITWGASNIQAQIAPDSAYGGDYGYPIAISASAPSNLSIWLKSTTAGQQFILYFQDTSGSGSGSPVHTAFFQNGTGSNYYLTIPTANTWTNFTLPLTAGTSVWSTDPTTLNWGAILDIGTVFQGPTTGSFPQQTTVYMDDYSFNYSGPTSPTATNTITNTPTNTWTPTPTGSATYTPTYTFTATTCPTDTHSPTFTPTGSWTVTPTYTFTITPTPTPTGSATYTPVPGTAMQFENWEGPYVSGNMWASFATCANASYIVNPYVSSAALTTCYDSAPGDSHGGGYCWKNEITWTSANGQAQIAPDSAYGGDYGYPISISASTPGYLSIWLKSTTAGQPFFLYFNDTSGPGSGSILHTAYYQNGTGTNYPLTISAANTWTNFTLPLTPGTGIWGYDPTLMNWGSILSIGTVFQGPGSGSFPQATNIYMDDYSFTQFLVPTNTPTFTPTGTWYTSTPTNTPTNSPTNTCTNTPTPTPTGTWYSPTFTLTPNLTMTMIIDYTNTFTNTPTGTLPTWTPTFTLTPTPSGTWYTSTPSNTPTPSWTSNTDIPTFTLTFTITPTPAATPIATASTIINPSALTTLSLPDGTTVSIPAGSFSLPVTLTINEYPIAVAPGTSTAYAIKFMNYAYLISAGGYEPAPGSSVTITMPYDPSAIPPGDTTADLALNYFNGASWVTLPSTLNTSTHMMSVVVDHFSWWAPGGKNLSPTPDMTHVSHGQAKTVVYPNPATGSSVSVSLPLVDGAEDVKVQVYSLSFRKVLELDYKQVRQAVTFDLRDKSGIPLSDGLYYVVVDASHGGRTLLKLLVLR